MPRDQFTRVHLDTFGGADAAHAVPRADTAFCIALLADLSARAGREAAVPRPPLGARRPALVDRDDLERVMAQVAPSVTLALDEGAPPVVVRAASLDDLHPDRLYERLPLFAALRETRRRLADPATFAEAARALGASGGGTPATPATPAPPGSAGSLLDQIVGDGPEQGPPPEQGGELAAFIRQAVRPHLVPRPDPRQAELLAAVDAAIAAQLRRVLHHPAFQALEATWRGLDFLVRRVETGGQLRLAVFDVTAAELLADAAGDAAGDGVAAMLAGGAQAMYEPAPWSLVVPLFELGDHAAELALLRRLGEVGAGAGAAVLASAHPRLAMLAAEAAAAEDAELPAAAADPTALEARSAWRAIRRSPAAAWTALLLPRVLLRLPYGEEGEPCDLLRFEELEPPAPGATPEAVVAERHPRLLWGSAGLVGAAVYGAAFAEDGWQMRPRAHLDVERLPLFLHRAGGTVVAQPVAEMPLGVDDAQQLLAAGLLPVVTRRESDAVRLAGLGSVAERGGALVGRWGSEG